ncbi:MAG: phosphoenolpyruvate synthase [Candidatus Woesearchaeota archaeon]
MNKNKKFILWFNELGVHDTKYVGGKNASLGEMYTALSKSGVKIPNGFAVTAYAYDYLLEKAKIREHIKSILKGLDVHNMDDLARRGKKVRETILAAEFPEELKTAISKAYARLCREYGEKTDVAVRSSATAEDLPTASFAGQQETYLNITGDDALMEACKKCFASLFTNRAISYREDKGFDHFNVALSIGVQKMVRSDLASSGVMFSIDTESGFKDVVLINSSYGLGENIVQGAVNPDEFFVFKPTLLKGYRPIISKNIGSKSMKMIYDFAGNKTIKNVPVDARDRNRFSLTDNEILTLAKWACIIEKHYTKKYKRYAPMDMEWAKDGNTGQIFIVQARPETVQSQKNRNVLETYVMKEKGKVLATGKSVGEKIGTGKAMIIKDVHEINRFKKGFILVTEMTDPDWEPIMKIASGIVTNRGGRTCHAAIISRELGIPCIVGTGNATETVRENQEITVSCAEGDEGYVYDKILKFVIEKTNLEKMPKTRTKVMMNIGNPEQAFSTSFIPNEGVGLAREEFIINSYIKIHPSALLHPKKVKDPEDIRKIEELTAGYKDKAKFYVDKLSEGIARIAAAFYPKDVILRLSDFKTNEYANLIGGKSFEPKEDNPMLGWRGASRYYSDNFRDAFALECKAILKCRKEMGLNNIKVMIPMCRTIGEGKKVLAEMAKNGLKKGEDKLEVYVMCEVPSNVLLADQFSKIFDGFSIGSNDLTQFTLAVDRDSALVAHIFEERDDAVKSLVASVIAAAKKNKRKIGICGQAPSDKPDFAEFLVECGIDTISLNPDTVIKTTLRIAEKERRMKSSSKKRKK